MVTLPCPKFFFFPFFLFRAAWEKGVIKAQAQNVARNLADTPANLMTPTIFAQVSFMPICSYILCVLQHHSSGSASMLCVYMPYFLSYNVLLPMMPPTPVFRQEMYSFFHSIMVFSCCSSLPSFCFWGKNSTFHHVKKNQLDAQLIVSLFPQPVHVSCISRPIRTTDSHLKRIISTNCCVHTVVTPDDGPRYARNNVEVGKIY